MKKLDKELVIKELKDLSNQEVDTLYFFIEELLPSFNLEEITELENVLNLIDNKELLDEKI